MSEHERYQLKEGTLLDQRYLILRVLGSGGFGITYEGINQRIGIRVAIKEFFCREYLDRDTEKSSDVILTDPDREERFQREKRQFLKEARITGDFQNDPGIVRVLDYFEENQTAYMVMEYLEGITVSQWIRNEGSQPAARVFRRMLGPARTLKHLHDCGLIHRDVSPDNLMLLKDTSMKLLDFGSARDYTCDSQEEWDNLVKGSYAACEQYDPSEKEGPFTDVYGLCAVIYYSITRNDPEDCRHRMLYDELKSPSLLGISIDPALEAVLMKGLQLEPEQRYPDMGALISAMEDALHLEKKRGKKVPFSRWIAAGSAAVLLGAAALAFIKSPETFLFFGEETEVVQLIPAPDLTEQEYEDSLKVLKERLQVLAGKGRYVIRQEKDNTISIITPSRIYEEMSAAETARLQLACPGSTSLVNPGDAAQVYPLQPEDIRRVTVDAEAQQLEVVLTDEKAEELSYVIEDMGSEVWFGTDVERAQSLEESWNYWTASIGEDGKTFCVDASQKTEQQMELQKYNLTHEGFLQPFDVYCGTDIIWDQFEDGMLSGENQKTEEEMGDPAVYLRYVCRGNDKNELDLEERHQIGAVFKKRLDALGIDYALGREENSETIVVKIAGEDLHTGLMTLLGDTGSLVQVNDNWSTLCYTPYDSFWLKEQEDGTWKIVISYSEYSRQEARETLEEMIAQGSDTLYLDINGYRIAQCPLNSQTDPAALTFETTCLDESGKITEDNLGQFSYLQALAESESLSVYYELSRIDRTEADRKLDLSLSSRSGKYLLPQDSRQFERLEAMAEKINKNIQITETASGIRCLKFTLSLPYNQNLAEVFISQVKELYQEGDLGSGIYDQILMEWKDADWEHKEYLQVSFQKDYEKRAMTLGVYMRNGRLDEQALQLRESLETDEFYRGFIEAGRAFIGLWEP